MTIILNQTGNPITREERQKINQNWDRIISGLTALQHQITTLANGEDVTELLENIKKATADANRAAQDAVNATKLTAEATQNAIKATQDAINATKDITDKIQELEKVITESKALNTTSQQKINEMTALITTGNQLAMELQALKTLTEELLVKTSDAYEKIKGWDGAIKYNPIATYSRNNVVTFGGRTWQSKVDNNKGNEPQENANWIMLADKGMSYKLTTIPAHLETTIANQKSWELPSLYDDAQDSLIAFFNTVYLKPENYTITGDLATGFKLNFDSPEQVIADNNVDVVIYKNVPNIDQGLINTSDILDGSITWVKLSKEVQDKINAGGSGSILDIVDDLVTGGSDKALSAEQGKVLKGEVDTVNNKLIGTNALVSENTTKIAENATDMNTHVNDKNIHVTSTDKTKLAGIEEGANKTELVNDLTTGGANKALTAEQGKQLKILIDKGTGGGGVVVTEGDVDKWNKKMDGKYWLAADSDQEDPRNHAMMSFNTGGKAQRFVVKHDNVQNKGETGIQWAVTTEQAGTSGRYIQTAYKMNGSSGDIKTRLLMLDTANGTVISGTWSPSTQELFQSVSDGKAKVASAITGKGVQTASDATFDEMAANIAKITSGGGEEKSDQYFTKKVKWTGDKALLSYTESGDEYFYNKSKNYNVVTVNSPFKPTMVDLGTNISVTTADIDLVYSFAGHKGTREDYFLYGVYTDFYKNKAAGINRTELVTIILNQLPNDTWDITIPVSDKIKTDNDVSIAVYGKGKEITIGNNEHFKQTIKYNSQVSNVQYTRTGDASFYSKSEGYRAIAVELDFEPYIITADGTLGNGATYEYSGTINSSKTGADGALSSFFLNATKGVNKVEHVRALIEKDRIYAKWKVVVPLPWETSRGDSINIEIFGANATVVPACKQYVGEYRTYDIKWDGAREELYHNYHKKIMSTNVKKIVTPFFPSSVTVMGKGDGTSSQTRYIEYQCNAVVFEKDTGSNVGTYMSSHRYIRKDTGEHVSGYMDSWKIEPKLLPNGNWEVSIPTINDAMFQEVERYSIAIHGDNPK